MLRFMIVCLLVVGAATGCANLKSPSLATGYCLTGTGRSCPELEGDGDCQPCPTSAVAGGARHLSSNTLEQRLP
jgi:hypothetical protein